MTLKANKEYQKFMIRKSWDVFNNGGHFNLKFPVKDFHTWIIDISWIRGSDPEVSISRFCNEKIASISFSKETLLEVIPLFIDGSSLQNVMNVGSTSAYNDLAISLIGKDKWMELMRHVR